MEVRPGYKQTEVGIIPDDWAVTPLGNHAVFKTGPFGSLLHRSDYVEDGIPVINPMQILDGKLVPTSSMSITKDAVRRLAAFRLRTDDVVIGRRGDMGRCACVRPDNAGWLCGTGSMIISCRPSIWSEFLQRLLSSPPVIAAIENASVGTTMVNLNNATLSKLLIPLPTTKAEQEAIAEALSDADALIESLERLIAKKRQVNQGAMQELLTGKRRLPGFAIEDGYKQTELGLIPHDWNPTTIGDIASKVGSGITPTGGSSNYKECGRPFVRSQNVGWGSLLLDDLAYIDDETHRTFSATELRGGDILLNITGASIGRSATASSLLEGGNVNQHVCIIRIGSGEAASRFVNHFLLSASGQRQIDSFQAGGNREGLNFGQIRSIKLGLPSSKTEQETVAAILDDMNAEIAALEAKLAKTRQLKQGMMQELLTGRIRLV
jgi:type I restriction enzyme S subunit